MVKNKIAIIAILGSSLFFSGCVSKNNLFGVGYEHSACESSQSSGVCGAPEDVYRFKDLIRQVQSDYRRSGIKQKLFFSITHDGRMLVKSERTGKYQPYIGSKWEAMIQANLYKHGVFGAPMTQGRYSSAFGRNDLSVQFKNRSPYIQTNTNLGRTIRNGGEVQRIWVAPVEDKKGDLVSAHELYTVVKKPTWSIGEKTPKHVKRSIKLPTPISKDSTGRLNRVNKKEENIIQNFVYN